MKPNQKLVGKDGKQVLLFPLPTLNITQGFLTGSHCCNYSWDCGYASDKVTLYAPCDCHKIYQGVLSAGNVCSFVSDNPVHTPKGLSYVTFQFTHGDLLGNGQTYKQGEPIYTTGTYGIGDGDHVHIDQSFVKDAGFIDSGMICRWSGGTNRCYTLVDSVNPTDVWFINDTNIGSTLGLKFQTYTGGSGVVLNWIIPVDENYPFERSRYLDEDEMHNNAKCFYGVMNLKYGFTLESICGMLGNIQFESACNPNAWQDNNKYSHDTANEGFGLVQWTPYTNITNWLEQKGYWGKFETYGDAECEKINEEMENGQQWLATAGYPLSFKEFAKSTQSVEYLAQAFLYNYERPQVPISDIRAKQARYWYNYLKDWTPVLPNDEEQPYIKNKSKIWMYMKPRWKRLF